MSHGKIIGGSDKPGWDQGDFHRVAFSSIQERDVFEADMGFREQVSSIEAGKPLINPQFADVIAKTHAHEVTPNKVIDSTRSAHGVSFGRLIGHKASKGREGTLLSVAYKPFQRADKALQEFNGYLALAALGVETYEPVGVFGSEAGDHFIVISKKRDDLLSLDRDEWIVGRQPRDEREVEVAERNARTILEIAETMAWLHANACVHPDGQIKNWAVTSVGTIGVIDTENFRSGVTDPHELSELAWNDIEKLTKSLVVNRRNLEAVADPEIDSDKIFGVGMLANMRMPQVRASLEELIIKPYIATLEGLAAAENISDKQTERLTALIFKIVDRFYDENNYPEHLVDAA